MHACPGTQRLRKDEVSEAPPGAARLLRDPGHFLSLGGGTGLMPFAPGTWGSVPGVALAWLLMPLGEAAYWGILAALFLLGIPLCARTARALNRPDPGAIVWDEVVGMAITLGIPAGLGSGFGPVSPLTLLAGFGLFRILDILKPWPIRWLERRLAGGLGVMADDALAGLVAGGVLVACL